MEEVITSDLDPSGKSNLRAHALAALDAAVLVKSDKGTGFREVKPMPGWWASRFGSADAFRDRSPFLEDFADEAAADFWESDTEVAATLPSGIWEESGAEDGPDFPALVFDELSGCRAIPESDVRVDRHPR